MEHMDWDFIKVFLSTITISGRAEDEVTLIIFFLIRVGHDHDICN